MIWSRTLSAWLHQLCGASSLGPLPAGCGRRGKRHVFHGRPFVENLGQLQIGDRFHLNSRPVQSHLVTGPEGVLDIGDDVFIEYGTGVAAHAHVKLGNRVRIGPYAMILDTDFHDLNDRAVRPKGLPITIGDDVQLGAWVTVLCGSIIGSGARILPGSVVRSAIPAGVVAGGVPARVLAPTSDAG